MCIVSMVVDEAHRQWPPFNPLPYNPIPNNTPYWDMQSLADLKEVIRLLGSIDKKLGAKDCYDPKKEKFIQELDERLKRLEDENSNNGG